MNGTVLWNASRYGYRVQVFKAGENEPEYDYMAGNHRYDSQAWVDPSSLNAESYNTLCMFAEQTADRLAKEYGISTVERDEDIDCSDEY